MSKAKKTKPKVVAALTWTLSTVDEGSRIAARVLAVQADAAREFAQNVRGASLSESASNPVIANLLVMAQGYEAAADTMLAAAKKLLYPKRAKAG